MIFARSYTKCGVSPIPLPVNNVSHADNHSVLGFRSLCRCASGVCPYIRRSTMTRPQKSIFLKRPTIYPPLHPPQRRFCGRVHTLEHIPHVDSNDA